MSTVSHLQKQEVSGQLSRMSLYLKDLRGKGLKKIMIEKEDQQLGQLIEEQLTGRKDYLRTIIPMLVRKTRDNSNYGNFHSRLERGRAYIDRLEHNFDNKFVFRPPRRLEED
jgi:hypothetical protein